MVPRADFGRIYRFAALAWLVMLAITCTAALTLAMMKGTGDPDMTSPLELPLLFGMVSVVPFAVGSFGIMAPLGILLDRWLARRTSVALNMAAGALLALPALFVWLVVGTLLWSRRGLVENISGFFSPRYHPDQLFLISILLIGGAVVGLGFRRKTADSATLRVSTHG